LVLETFDVEVAFLSALLLNPVYIEWPKGLKELVLLSKEECDNTCAELTRAMTIGKHWSNVLVI
jgi:hypothetical protein